MGVLSVIKRAAVSLPSIVAWPGIQWMFLYLSLSIYIRSVFRKNILYTISYLRFRKFYRRHFDLVSIIRSNSRYITYKLRIVHTNRTTKCLKNQSRAKGEYWSTANGLSTRPSALSNCIVGRPKALIFLVCFMCCVLFCLLVYCLWRER